MELLEDDEVLVWIDWCEEDDEMIRCCEERLNTGSLSFDFTDAENQLGYEMSILYKDKRVVILFDPEKVSRDATLITLN